MAENLSTPIQETQHDHCINESEELRRRLADLEYKLKKYKEKIDKLEKEKELLKNRQLEQLKDAHLHHLQYSGQLCANNCFLCTILWTCQKKLGVFPCGLQLLLLLFKYKLSTQEIRPENHMCHKLIVEIFIKCGIVTEANRFEYPSELNAKNQVIGQVWNTLMTTDSSERVMILGRVISVAEEKGHAQVCDLESRRLDEKGLEFVTIHDPQIDKHEEANKDNFREYVDNDEGVILYNVKLGELMQIFKHDREGPEILHLANQCNQSC